jgi:hypothetical protein
MFQFAFKLRQIRYSLFCSVFLYAVIGGKASSVWLLNTPLIFSTSIHYTRLLLYIYETLFRLYPRFAPRLVIETANKCSVGLNTARIFPISAEPRS